jgi:RNA-directed DNA polymerase
LHIGGGSVYPGLIRTGLPKNKSLFFSGNNCGLPIGNLTSQLFSNIYLDDFDHFIKRGLKFKYYGRYVDDFIIISDDKKELKRSFNDIERYLKDGLGLRINKKKIYLQRFEKGVNFLGAIIKPYRIYVRNRIKSGFYGKVGESSIASYLGLLKHYNTYNLREKAFYSIN